MAIILKEVDINRLLAEKKPLSLNGQQLLALKPKRGHKENEIEAKGTDGSIFRLIIRLSNSNPLDFSVILAYILPRTNQIILLRRYNGKSHSHTNPLEHQTFYDFHIHQITERYQDSPRNNETYAEPTNRYSDLAGAIECLIIDCGFELPYEPQRKLF